MQLSINGLSLIKQFEGFRDAVYLDAAGMPTVGYGHLLTSSEKALYSGKISQHIAEQLLHSDVAVAEQAVRRLIRVSLSQGQFDALVSFTYNLGGGVLERSTLRRKLNRSEYEDVPEQFLCYVWAGGRKLTGLMRRRQAEIKLFIR